MKKFSESIEFNLTKWESSPQVFCVIQKSEEYSAYQKVHCFNNMMMAADYVIKYINSIYDQDFEVYYDNEGNRFFTNIDENDDFGYCISYCDENEVMIEIVEGYYHTSSKVIKQV